MRWSDKEKARLKSKYGEWAVVTGASSGIGLELATLLANAGLNLVLHGRQPEKLQAAERRITENTSIQTRLVEEDISNSKGIDQLIAATRGLDVGLLVASAGFGTSGQFIHSSLHTEINMLRVNCEALLSLTHYFSQQFVRQKRGGIILMSSMVAFQGTPYAANYAATKAYVQSLAEGIAAELKPYGVDVLAAAPGPVESGFGERANMRMSMSLTPSQIGIPILNFWCIPFKLCPGGAKSK